MNKNNFFVSDILIEKINFKIKQYDQLIEEEKINPQEIKQFEVTKEELELLKAVDERKEICKSENMHYWIIPNSHEPYKSHCHWCLMKVTDYK